MKQPAISRSEQADYQNWNLNTLRIIAEAQDARIRVLIEAVEDILRTMSVWMLIAHQMVENRMKPQTC
jgi:hypothetical protein